MNQRSATLLCILALATGLSGCGVTSEATTLPFDLASTTGDAASSASSSGSDEEEATAMRARHYVNSQIAWIEREAATGEGEHIRTLAVLLGESDADAFATWAQANHAMLFADLESPEQLLARIDAAR